MNYITIIIGELLCIYAVIVLIYRIRRKEKYLKKLKAMKEKFGKNSGSLIHFIAYVIIPFAAGISIIISGTHGKSIMDWLNF